MKSAEEETSPGNIVLKSHIEFKFDKKIPLFGLEAAKSWILLANYLDPTLIMNATAFELANRFKMKYSHHFFHVDVVLNGEYLGNYLITEHNQVGAGRVDIDKTNGFLVELDRYYDEEPIILKANFSLSFLMISSISPQGWVKPEEMKKWFAIAFHIGINLIILHVMLCFLPMTKQSVQQYHPTCICSNLE